MSKLPVRLRRLLSLCALAGSIGLPRSGSPQVAGEEILSYDVRIELGAGGVMQVTEAIQVRAQGAEIRRGIYRDFPTRFPREGLGGEIVAPFRVTSVTRDARPEPYVLEQILGVEGRGGIRVRIGRADVHLAPGVYTYLLVYETERWLRYGESRDELYWNVTGNGWTFPIRSATAQLVVPGDGSLTGVTLEAWTGPEGSEAQNATWRWDPSSRTATYRTIRPLAAFEGLTLQAILPTGVVASPTETQQAVWFDLDWSGYFEAGYVVVVVVLLYLLMWVYVGRDPPGRAIMVRYEPPEGFSPAQLGYLRERGYRAAQLNAGLVELAVKGAVTIEKDGRKWRIESTDKGVDGLSLKEASLFRKLLDESGSLTLSGTSNSRLRKAAKEFRKGLRQQLEKHYFVTNRRWFVVGLVVSIVGLVILAWRARFSVSPEIWFLGFWLSFWTVGVSTLLYRVYLNWAQAISGDPLAGVGAVFLTLFSIPFVVAELFVAYLLYQGAPGHLAAAAVVIGALNVLFYHVLERPTLKGRGVLDELEGFRRYLGATEEDTFDRLQPPDRSLEIFERFLPYAIALEVSNRWAERFETVLTPADRPAAASQGRLSWYSGGRFDSSDLTSVTSSLGSSFSSSLSAASAAPSSSGGGRGGGGSAGGGGGGGGGGGW